MASTSLSDYRLDAPVFTRTGEHVGRLHRLLVERDSFRLAGLVVEESARFSGRVLAPGAAILANDLVVPLDGVADVDRDRITLALDAREVRGLAPYLSLHFEPAGSGHDVAGSLEAWVLRPLAILGGVSVPSYTETARKPESEIEVSVGEEVRGGGESLGEVREILVEGGEMVGVVLSPGLFQKEVILPRRFLSRSSDLELEALIDREDLKNLEPFEPEG